MVRLRSPQVQLNGLNPPRYVLRFLSTPLPPFFWKSVIPWNFKCNEFVSVHSKELTRPFFVSVHSSGVTSVAERQSDSGTPIVHEALIPGGFKSNEFATGHSIELRRPLFVRVHSKELIHPGGHSWRVCISKRPARSSGEISGLEAEPVSVNIGVACVDMVRAKRSPSTRESRKPGPGIRASSRKGILFPNFRRAAIKDQESSRVEDPYYSSCYHKVGALIARIAHFL